MSAYNKNTPAPIGASVSIIFSVFSFALELLGILCKAFLIVAIKLIVDVIHAFLVGHAVIATVFALIVSISTIIMMMIVMINMLPKIIVGSTYI